MGNFLPYDHFLSWLWKNRGEKKNRKYAAKSAVIRLMKTKKEKQNVIKSEPLIYLQ